MARPSHSAAERPPTQRRAVAPNRTGLPDHLKSGMESLSGMSLDHVRMHRNPAQPAQLNAHAYAQGSDIHLAPGQEKHLPHEAWHVVQQAQGRVPPITQLHRVPLYDDAGRERAAEVTGAKVAQRPGVSRATAGLTVQRIEADELHQRGTALAAIGQLAPEQSMNLWVATNTALGARIHLLGTMHTSIFAKMKEARALVSYLSSARFTHVYSEIATDIAGVTVEAPERMIELVDQEVAGEPDRKKNRDEWIKYKQDGEARGILSQHPLDETYAALALHGSGKTTSLGLETDEGLRAEASGQNEKHLPGKHGKPAWDDKIEEAVKSGNQKFMFDLIAKRMQSGHDYEDTEERNKRWIESRVTAHGAIKRGDNQLWIVGASHLPGLVLRLAQAGWTVTTQGLITDPNDGHGRGHVDRASGGGVEAARTRL